MEPIVLFGIQFTLSLLVYALLASWYVVPRLASVPKELALVPLLWSLCSGPSALVPLLWVHAFRIIGGAILAPGATDPAVPADFRTMIGYGDMITAFLAIIALLALRARFRGALAVVWLFLIVGTADTVNVIVQSIRDSVFTHPLGVNWLIVTMYVPALIVSNVLIVIYLLKPRKIAVR